MLINHYPWLLDILGVEYSDALKLTKSSLSNIEGKFYEEFQYQSVGRGYSREVYDTGIGWVIKFPIHEEGIEGNLIEAKIYQIYKNSGRYAKCYIKDYHGIPLLVMELVTDLSYTENGIVALNNLPDWALHEDGPQVGFNKDKNLRIYDYGACMDELVRWWVSPKSNKRKFLTRI